MGDRFYLLENQILCEFDYEERLLLTNNYNNPAGSSPATSTSQQLPPNSHGIQRRVSDFHQVRNKIKLTDGFRKK